MKKIQHIIPGAAATLAACSLISAVLLCGCSKDLQEQQAVSSLSEGDVELTIEVTGDAGTRTTITQENKILPVLWKTGDKLYVVGADDGYLGCLTQTGDLAGAPLGRTATFKGSVKGWSKAQKLHIYYLGDTDPSLSSGADKYTFDISAQLGTLAGIASSGQIAHGATASLAPGTKTIATSLTMSNLNAVVLFDLSKWPAEGTKITGTYNSAVLDLKAGAFSTKTDGSITIAAGETTYVSFIPDNIALTFTQSAGYATTTMANNIEAGCFYSNDGAAVEVPFPDGNFSVSADKKVLIAEGNLYSTGGSTWGFESNPQSHRFDYGVFGWIGTDASNSLDSYGRTYATRASYSFGTSETMRADWANISSLPQIAGRKWETPAYSEWYYLLFTRTVKVGRASNTSYGQGSINGICGLIILPDGWDGSVCTGFRYGESAWANAFTTTSWTAMKNAGCVFLPVTGWGNADLWYNSDDMGFYWSSTRYNDDGLISAIHFKGSSVFTAQDTRDARLAVRLFSVIK